MHNKFIQNDIIQSWYIFIANIASCIRKKYGITKKERKKRKRKRKHDLLINEEAN